MPHLLDTLVMQSELGTRAAGNSGINLLFCQHGLRALSTSQKSEDDYSSDRIAKK